MTLQQVADHLGLHYMTVYRYVRTGRLAARRTGGRWSVDRVDVERLRRPGVIGSGPAASATAGPGRPDRAAAASRLERRLLAGDEPGAWLVVQAVVAAGASAGDVLVDVLAPALAGVGDRWAAGTATVGDEHRATQVATRLVSRLGAQFARPGRRSGTVVVGTPPGDRHTLPVAIAADLLRGAGLAVVELGADVPAGMFAAEAAALAGQPAVVAVGVTTAGLRDRVVDVVAAVRAGAPGVPIVVGGAGIEPDDVAALGADAASGADARTLIDQVVGLLGARPAAG